MRTAECARPRLPRTRERHARTRPHRTARLKIARERGLLRRESDGVLDDADVRDASLGKRLPDLPPTLRREHPHRHHRETVVGKDFK